MSDDEDWNLEDVADEIARWKDDVEHDGMGEERLTEGFALLRKLRTVTRQAPPAVGERAKLLAGEVEGFLIEEPAESESDA